LTSTLRRILERRPLTRIQHRHKEAILTQRAPAKVRESVSAIVLKVEDIFLVVDEAGDAPSDREHALGLFYHDCRFLDEYELFVDGIKPTVLSAAAARGYQTRHDLANPDFDGLPKNTVGIRRERLIRDHTLLEIVTIGNFATAPARFSIEVRFGSRFDDIFMLRGYVTRKPGHRVLEPTVATDRVRLGAEGLDGMRRWTTIAFSPAPERLTKQTATYDLRLAPGTQLVLSIAITPSIEFTGSEDGTRPAGADGVHPRVDLAEVPAASLGGATATTTAVSGWLEEHHRAWLAQWSEVRSSNPLFDVILERSFRDLRMLRTPLLGRHFEAAGIPWFATLFGRDSAIVGLQMLPYGTTIARDTLRLLAHFQASVEDRYRDAEPGKILHELRMGELARAKLVPQSPAYYGSVDATLLFLILLGEYLDWCGDDALARELLPNARAAIDWSVQLADHDGDGFIDYSGEYENGLVNQGWKDSGNAIVNADGSLARPPIAMAEVQAYAYRAWRTAARMLRRLGEDASLADALERHAEALRVRFEERFWSDELDCYVMALQRGGDPCAVASSNAGQVLWGGIASPERAARVARRLLDDDLFSGWGIRTLSAGARAYNPISYHLGSVWPHDNSLILSGLRSYGFDDEASRVFGALLSASEGMRDYRLPELYCGYGRKPDERRPVEYPVACVPQAWSAGALPYALYRMLGLEADGRGGTLRVVRPLLPENVEWIELRRLNVGESSIDLRFRREGDRVAWDGDVTRGTITLEMG
jgi:glycogen debranching enzyme